MKSRVYIELSRKNLLELIAKLDRVKAGGTDRCDLIKIAYPSTIIVHAAENEVVYRNRRPGSYLRRDPQ